nr:ArsR family transcriptional regulator [Rhodococcus rhodochrous]
MVRVNSSARPSLTDSEDRPRGWTFLTNHAHVLLCVARGGHSTVRELAQRIGITERSVQTIFADPVDGGYLTRTRVGRRSTYSLNPEGGCGIRSNPHTVGELIDALR